MQIVVNRLPFIDLSLKKLCIPLLRPAACFIGKIPFQLLNVGSHIFWVRNAFIFRITVKFNDIFQEADQGLRVHDHVVAEEIHAVESSRHPDHHHSCQRGVEHLKRLRRPSLHLGIRLFLRAV